MGESSLSEKKVYVPLVALFVVLAPKPPNPLDALLAVLLPKPPPPPKPLNAMVMIVQ